MKLKSSTLRALALGCTALIPIASAQAQQSFTVSNGETVDSARFVSGGGTGLVEDGGTINISGGLLPFAIHSSGDTITNVITHSGTIITSTDSGVGIVLSGYSDLTVTSTGTIATSGINSHGIYASGRTTVTLDGAISTSNSDSIGIDAVDSLSAAEQVSILVGGTGSVTTSGSAAHGIYLGDYNVLTLEDGAYITTNYTGTGVSEASYGIYAQDNTTIDSAADITTSGPSAHGILLNGTGNALTHSGTISTGGDSGHGTKAAVATLGGELRF